MQIESHIPSFQQFFLHPIFPNNNFNDNNSFAFINREKKGWKNPQIKSNQGGVYIQSKRVIQPYERLQNVHKPSKR